MGTSVRDMDRVAEATNHVAGTSRDGSDPSAMTALGVHEGIKAALHHRLGNDALSGLTVAVQGLGHVGHALCERLSNDGANLVVADVSRARVECVVDAFGATAVAAECIHAVAADVFAPCALGAVLDDKTIPALRSAIVAGSANNQLAEDRHGEELRRRGILYAPDYAINAGGLISIANTIAGEEATGGKVWTAVCRIGPVLGEIFGRGRDRGTAAQRRRRPSRHGARRAPPAERLGGPGDDHAGQAGKGTGETQDARETARRWLRTQTGPSPPSPSDTFSTSTIPASPWARCRPSPRTPKS